MTRTSQLKSNERAALKNEILYSLFSDTLVLRFLQNISAVTNLVQPFPYRVQKAITGFIHYNITGWNPV